MRQLGRRGAILLCYGTVWALYGYAQITSPQPDQRGLQPILERVPLTVWGCLWVATGLTAIVSAFLPQGRDWVGFLALPGMVLPWMTSYLLAWLMGDFPRGWVAALVWAVIAVPVLVVAGWREPPRVKRVSETA
jgi:fatty acid desaturase